MTKIKYLLSLNRYSRNGKNTNSPKKIVLHHAEKEGNTAIELRNYFEGLKLGKNAIYYSTHYIVGLEGEVIYCVPEDEIAYHRGNNEESSGAISITCCSKENASEPSANSLISLRQLVREISKRHGFHIENDFLRHYDVSGLKCPQFYVDNEDKWSFLKDEILKEVLILKEFAEKSEILAEKVSHLTGLQKAHLAGIFHERITPDISSVSRIVQELIKSDI